MNATTIERVRWVRRTGTCPDCGYSLDTEGHDKSPCGEQGRCNQCERPMEPMADNLCARCTGTAKAHARLEQARIDEERGVARRMPCG